MARKSFRSHSDNLPAMVFNQVKGKFSDCELRQPVKFPSIGNHKYSMGVRTVSFSPRERSLFLIAEAVS